MYVVAFKFSFKGQYGTEDKLRKDGESEKDVKMNCVGVMFLFLPCMASSKGYGLM